MACVSKLSTVLNILQTVGPCLGKSVAEPPHKIITSISFFIEDASSTENIFESWYNVDIESGLLLVKIPFSSISGLFFRASSTPFPKFPYP